MLIGVLGAIVPVLPGAPLGFLALVILYLVRDGSVSGWLLLILGILAVLSVVADYAIPALGAKAFGATKWGIWGSIGGMLLGAFFFPPMGMIAGLFLGAIIGEALNGKDALQSVKAGTASVIGSIVAALLKFILAVVMAIVFFGNLF